MLLLVMYKPMKMIRTYRVTVKMRQNVITGYVQANENVLFESRKWENQWE